MPIEPKYGRYAWSRLKGQSFVLVARLLVKATNRYEELAKAYPWERTIPSGQRP